MRHFTSVHDVTDLNKLVADAMAFKQNPFQPTLAIGKKVGLIFLNPSLRTRLSSQIAARNLGAEVVVLDIGKDGWALEFEDGALMNGNKAEHIKEAAGVMGRYFDLLGVRTFPELKSKADDYSENLLNAFIKHSNLPVLSLESGTRHPLQSLADLITIKEQWTSKTKPKVVLTWAPHVKALPQAVPNSFAEWMKASDVHFSIANPVGYNLAPEFTDGIEVFHDQEEALRNADFVYVKNWSSYDEYGKILSKDESWSFGSKQLELTENAKVMHCLPVRRGLVIRDEILDGPNAIHLEQAENRIYAAQAVIHNLLHQ
jgi:N-succinyl-L-ornithine transcarbamylase